MACLTCNEAFYHPETTYPGMVVEILSLSFKYSFEILN